MISLTWPRVHAWRLAQHGLSPRLPAGSIVQAVSRTSGIQSQVISAAELALCTRVEGLTPQEVQAALFQEHSLVKTWAMRGTLHLLPAGDLPLYLAARNWQLTERWSTYFASAGLSSAQQEAFLQAIPHVLEPGPLTRGQLAEAVARHTGVDAMRTLILSESWGTPLKPSAYRGDLCFGPGQGKTATFLNPRAWLGTWQPIEPALALQEMARRYLRAYGPATADDFAFWWGCGKTPARRAFQALQAEVEAVEVEGWRAVALRETLPLMQRAEPVAQVRLLPLFDAYTLGVPRDCEQLLASAYKRQVFNQQGWTFAVVLVNGSIQGLWHATLRRTHVLLTVDLFTSSSAALRQGLEAEMLRLSQHFQKEVVLQEEPNERGKAHG